MRNVNMYNKKKTKLLQEIDNNMTTNKFLYCSEDVFFPLPLCAALFVSLSISTTILKTARLWQNFV